jgi:hypothetical protein
LEAITEDSLPQLVTQGTLNFTLPAVISILVVLLFLEQGLLSVGMYVPDVRPVLL